MTTVSVEVSSQSEKLTIMYDRHESKELGRVYKGYQGQDPAFAKLIFLGTDANFADDIEKTPFFEEVIEYLADGVDYWKRTGRHHPFLSPAYSKGSGYRYHYQFHKLGLSSDDADKISFVELLKCPTCGNETSYRRLMELLDVDYHAKLDAAGGSAVSGGCRTHANLSETSSTTWAITGI